MMKRTKGMISVLLVTALVMGMPMQGLAYQTTRQSLDAQINNDNQAISDAQSEKKNLESNLEAAQALKESLEKEKSELTGHLVELDSQMTDVSQKLFEVEHLLTTKQEEIRQTEKDLVQVKKDMEKQYEDMKLRIKFMYEKGTMSYIQIILSAGSFSEMLNKAAYIEQVSAYDRELLDRFEETRDKVIKLEKELEDQEEALSLTRDEVEKQQEEMEGLIADKQDEIEEYESDIANKEAAIEEYEQMIREQDATILALEKSVAAAKAKKNKLSVSGNSVNHTYGGGAFCWPAPSYTRISDDYGYRTHPILGVQQFHNGVDMAAPTGTPILAACDGTVVAASYSSTMGNYIMIDHGSGLYTIYMHASALYVSSGQDVSKGSQIGTVGSTGRSTGPHLHFSVRLNGSYASPWGYL